MDTITIKDLEVWYQVGVPDQERAEPQRLLITLELGTDLTAAAGDDDLAQTIDYDALARRVRQFGQNCHWKLIETLAVDLAQMVLDEFNPQRVTVQVKKFILPETRYVAAKVTRPA